MSRFAAASAAAGGAFPAPWVFPRRTRHRPGQLRGTDKGSYIVDAPCAHCGGRLRLIATLYDPAVIRKILAHGALAHSGQSPGHHSWKDKVITKAQPFLDPEATR